MSSVPGKGCCGVLPFCFHAARATMVVDTADEKLFEERLRAVVESDRRLEGFRQLAARVYTFDRVSPKGYVDPAVYEVVGTRDGKLVVEIFSRSAGVFPKKTCAPLYYLCIWFRCFGDNGVNHSTVSRVARRLREGGLNNEIEFSHSSCARRDDSA